MIYLCSGFAGDLKITQSDEQQGVKLKVTFQFFSIYFRYVCLCIKHFVFLITHMPEVLTCCHDNCDSCEYVARFMPKHSTCECGDIYSPQF